MKNVLFISVFLLFAAQSVFAQCSPVPVEEAVRNGDFEAGYLPGSTIGARINNHTHGNKDIYDFHCDLQYMGKWNGNNSTCNYSMGDAYGVGRVEFPACKNGGNKVVYGQYAGAANYKDHTKGTNKGFALILDFNSGGGWKDAWAQNVDVYGSQRYYFSAWFAMYAAASVKPNLRFSVTSYDASNTAIETVVLGSAPLQGAPFNWKQFSATYDTPANAVTALIRIECKPTGASNSDDILIDDISFINGCQNIASSIDYQVDFASDNESLCLNNGSILAQIKKDDGTNLGTGKTITWYEGTGSSQTELPAFANDEAPTITSPGTYRACVLDAANGGCSVNSTIVITENLNVNISDGDLCYPAELTLNTNRTETGLVHNWNVPSGATASTNNTQLANVGGAYEVTVNLPGVPNCTKTETANITSSLPDNPGPLTVCLGGTPRLSVGDGNKYLWLESDKSTVIGYENGTNLGIDWTSAPTTPGNYQVAIRSNDAITNFGQTSKGTFTANNKPNTNVKIRVVEPVALRSLFFQRESWESNANIAVKVKNVATGVETEFWKGWAKGGGKTVNGYMFLEPGDYEIAVGGSNKQKTSGVNPQGNLVGVVQVLNPNAKLPAGLLKFDRVLACEPILVDVTLANCCTPPSITTNPSDATICENGNNTFSVVATTANSGTLTYQWFQSTDGGTSFTQIAGANAASYDVTNATQDLKLIVQVDEDGANCFAYSDTVDLSIISEPLKPIIEGTQVYCEGDNLSINITSASLTATATYAWTLGGTPVTGTSDTYSASNITTTDGGDYAVTSSVTVGGVTCTGPASDNFAVTVIASPATPTITATPSPTDICIGDAFDLTATSTTAGVNFTWSNGTASGTNNETIAVNSATLADAGSYTVIADLVQGGVTCSSSASTASVVSINNLPSAAITTSGTDLEYCKNTTGASLAANGGNTYNWYISSNSSGTPDGSGTPFDATEGDWVVEVIDGNGCKDTSSSVTVLGKDTLTINTAPSLLCKSDDATISADGVYVIEITIDGGTVTSGSFSSTLSGGSTSTTTFSETTPGTWRSGEIDELTSVDLTVSNNNGCNVVSFFNLQNTCSCSATGNIALKAGSSDSLCTNGANLSTTLEVTYGGATGPYDITLYKNGVTEGTPQMNLSGGVTGGTVEFTVSSEGVYSALIFDQNGNCGKTTIGSVTIGQYPEPSASINGIVTDICNDNVSTYDLEVSMTPASSVKSGWSFEYTVAGGAATPINAMANNPFNLINTLDGVHEIIKVTDGNGCEANLTGVTETVTYKDSLKVNQTYKCDDESPLGGVTLSNSEFQLVFEITSGDVANILDDNASLGLQRDGASNFYYSSALDENNSVNITLSDGTNLCNTVSYTALKKQCSCPITATASFGGQNSLTICEGTSANLGVDITTNSVATATNYDISFSGVSLTGGSYTPSAADKSHSEPFTLSGLTPGNYAITATVASAGDGNCAATSSLNLTVTALPQLVSVSSQSSNYCEDQTNSINAEFSGSAPFTFYHSNNKNATIGNDNTVGNTGTFNTTNSDYSAWTYAIDSVTDAAGCTSVLNSNNTVSVTRNSVPGNPVLTSDQALTICQTDSYVITANQNAADVETPLILWSGDASGTSIAPATFNGLNNQTSYTYSAQAVNTQNSNCVSGIESRTVNLTTSGTVSIEAVESVVCADESINLTATVSNVSPTTEYIWEWEGFEQERTTNGTLSIDGRATGNWTVTVDNNTACGSTITSAQEYVTVNELPLPAINNSDVTICAPGTFELVAAQDLAGINVSKVEWYKDGNIINGANTNSYVVSETGKYSVVMYNGQCTSETLENRTTSTVNVQELSVSIPNAELLLEQGAGTTITANVSGAEDINNVQYEWIGDDQGTFSTENPASYTGQVSEYVTINISENGCSATAEIYARVLEPVNVPNAFSPNNDGTNDTWEIEGLDSYDQASVQVYNRWGQLVFNQSGEYTPWDGTNKQGNNLPVGTYYYVIKLNQPGKENLKGDLTIIK